MKAKKAVRSQLKLIRELLRRKEARDTNGLFVAEGLKIVRDIAAKGHQVDSLVVSYEFAEDDANKTLLEHFDKRNADILLTGVKELERTSVLKQPEGIMALVKKSDVVKAVLSQGDTSLAVICDSVQDPGNLGALIRTSVAFGSDLMILTGETVDPYNPRVVRSSSGMMLDLPIACCSYQELEGLKENGYRIYAAQADKENAVIIDRIKDPRPLSIVAFGSEGRGLSRELSERVDEFFYIPISDKAESLNVSSAAAIALYHFSRRRCSDG